MLSVVQSGALLGVKALPVTVEVNAGETGEARTFLVGLPDSAVKESNNRVASALANTGFRMPRTRTTINLAPGDLRKEGPLYDLPIALGILAATGQLFAPAIGDFIIAGELSLSGGLRPIKGGLALALLARDRGTQRLLLPPRTAQEAALVDELEVYCVNSLDDAVGFLEGTRELEPVKAERPERVNGSPASAYGVDFSEVKGQQAVRRAVEVAVAGGHNLLMIGPPGSGKSMIAKRIPTIMPEPADGEYLDILGVYSAAGHTVTAQIDRYGRPFRAPHHTVSDAALVGGGISPGPGEISLAHHGVLFLDELPEFRRAGLEVLRQPLEDGEVTISRAAAKVTLPASFMLVAAMNPCPCGYYGDPNHQCRCSPNQIQRYRARLSGPLLDRIDIHVEAPALAIGELRQEQPGECSGAMRERVAEARRRQQHRLAGSGTPCNARMGHKQIRAHVPISRSQGDLLQQAMERLNLSARAYDRILKVTRTIADLADAESINDSHLLEAIQYRSLDRTVMY